MSERLVIHVWGFFDGDQPRLPDGATAEEGSVYATHKAIEDNVVRHGGTVADLRVTRTLDGWLVGTEFETPAHDDTARMWHKIIQSSEPWGRRMVDHTAAPGAMAVSKAAREEYEASA